MTYPLTELEEHYLAHHRALGRSPHTIARYQATFRLFRRFLAETGREPDSQALATTTLDAFAVWLRTTPVSIHRGSTQRSEVGVYAAFCDLRAFIRYLHDEQLLARPVRVPLPKLPQKLFPVLTEAELDRVWHSRYLTGSSALAIRNRALVGLLLDTGLRRAEVVGLTPAEVDLSNCLLTVTGKGNKQRRVPFSTSVQRLLDDWLRVRGDEPGSLFWLQAQGVRMMLRRIRDEVGLKLLFPHQLRHTAATLMVRQNADPFTVQRILGHANLSTTQRYVAQSDADLRDKHAAASPFETVLGGRVEERPKPTRKRLSLRDG